LLGRQGRKVEAHGGSLLFEGRFSGDGMVMANRSALVNFVPLAVNIQVLEEGPYSTGQLAGPTFTRHRERRGTNYEYDEPQTFVGHPSGLL
jgi:hypothetical protein